MLSMFRNVDRWNFNLRTVAGYCDLRGKIIEINRTKWLLKTSVYISWVRKCHMTIPKFKMMDKYKSTMYLKGEVEYHGTVLMFTTIGHFPTDICKNFIVSQG